jgi:hypothetical protein
LRRYPYSIVIGSSIIPLWLWQSPTHVDGLGTGSDDGNLADWTSRNLELAEPWDGPERLVGSSLMVG